MTARPLLICLFATFTIPLAACGGDTPTRPSPSPQPTESVTWIGTLNDRLHGSGTLRVVASGRDGIFFGTWSLEAPSVAIGGPALVNLTLLGARAPAILLQPASSPCANPSSPAALATFSLHLSGSASTMTGTSTHLTCDNTLVEGRVELSRQ